jgi:hypothetical protein
MVSSFKFLDEACKERSFRGSRVMLIREKGYLSYFVLMNNEKGWGLKLYVEITQALTPQMRFSKSL